MRPPNDAELLALWERGLTRHAIDRAVLLGTWARPDLAPQRVADLPIGVLNEALLRLRALCFGARIDTYIECERCAVHMEVPLDAAALLASVPDVDTKDGVECAGFRFRAPSSRDLAAVAGDRDLESAARKLAARCRLGSEELQPDHEVSWLDGMLDEIEARLEAMDPWADLRLALTCEACGHSWSTGLDIGRLLWDEIDARARAVLAEVHRLASAYGWSESEILALTAARRAAYLDLVDA